jgi:hypothetical protein
VATAMTTGHTQDNQSINGTGNVMMSQASLIDPANHHNIATIATITTLSFIYDF